MNRRMVARGFKKVDPIENETQINTEAAVAISQGFKELKDRFGAVYHLLPKALVIAKKKELMSDKKGSSKLTKEIIKELTRFSFQAVIYPAPAVEISDSKLKQAIMYTTSDYMLENYLNIKFTESYYLGDIIGITNGLLYDKETEQPQYDLDDYYGLIYDMKSSNDYHVPQPKLLGGSLSVSCWKLTEVQ